MVLLKRTTLTKALILALFSTVAGAIFVNLAKANPAPLFAFPTEPITTLPTIVVHSPVQNQSYNSTNVWLNFTVVKPESWFAIDVAHHADHSPLSETFVNITAIYFTVDGGERQNIPVHDVDSLFDMDPILNLNFSTMLPLTAGAHAVKVGLEADSHYVVSYVYNFSEALSSVKLYAELYAVNFTVAGSSDSDAADLTLTEFSPTALIITASVTTVAMLSAGLLTYFKKRKR
ncbi:MAG TPA: hypothetical protein ENN36_05125 [Candidatus Bathyarchaeota archaeon]|nr:hypothetical protein [Candidatus Bathyarchaeota archaeon]